MVKQRVELARHREPGQVEVESTEVAEHVDVGARMSREHADPVGNEGEGRAGVRNDQLYIGVTVDDAVEHEVHDSASGVEEELQHRPRPTRTMCAPSTPATSGG